MKHARQDYNRFQDPALQDSSLLGSGSTPVKEDEPVMLFRAQDTHFLKVLNYYAIVLEFNRNKDVAESVRKHIELAKEWRKSNNVKEPDL